MRICERMIDAIMTGAVPRFIFYRYGLPRNIGTVPTEATRNAEDPVLDEGPDGSGCIDGRGDGWGNEYPG